MSLSITQHIWSIGAFYAAIQAIILLLGKRVNVAGRILGAWCLLLSIGFVRTMVDLNQASDLTLRLVGVSHFVPTCFGALLFLYCRYTLNLHCEKKNDWWHLTPLIVVLILNIETISASSQQIYSYFNEAPPSTLGFVVGEVLLFLQALIYIAASFFLVLKTKLRATATLSNFNPSIFNWLFALIILNIFIWTLKLMPLFGFQTVNAISDLFIVVFISAIAIAQWHDPSLFKLAASVGSEDESKSIKPNQAQLDVDSQQALANELSRYMEQSHTFKNADLSLRMLAQELNCSAHHLSEVLNQHIGQNFYEYINQQRIEYFKQRLTCDPKGKILELAFECGFSTKSTFNIAFKKYMGFTPSQFRKTLT